MVDDYGYDYDDFDLFGVDDDVEIPAIAKTVDIHMDITGWISVDTAEADEKVSYELISEDSIEVAVEQFREILNLIKKELELGKVQYPSPQLQKDMSQIEFQKRGLPKNQKEITEFIT